jgi:acylphosphatase
MKSLHLIIAGRVQGVGYRDWLVTYATAQGVSGWVRNTGEAEVEALLCGPIAAVNTVLAACHDGPPLARVDSVTVARADSIETQSFRRLPTV